MTQTECKLGTMVASDKHPERGFYVRENHNPLGAGLSSSLDTPPENSFFVLYEFLIPFNND